MATGALHYMAALLQHQMLNTGSTIAAESQQGLLIRRASKGPLGSIDMHQTASKMALIDALWLLQGLDSYTANEVRGQLL